MYVELLSHFVVTVELPNKYGPLTLEEVKSMLKY